MNDMRNYIMRLGFAAAVLLVAAAAHAASDHDRGGKRTIDETVDVFVDSGAWIALALTRDPLHARAVDPHSPPSPHQPSPRSRRPLPANSPPGWPRPQLTPSQC